MRTLARLWVRSHDSRRTAPVVPTRTPEVARVCSAVRPCHAYSRTTPAPTGPSLSLVSLLCVSAVAVLPRPLVATTAAHLSCGCNRTVTTLRHRGPLPSSQAPPVSWVGSSRNLWRPSESDSHRTSPVSQRRPSSPMDPKIKL